MPRWLLLAVASMPPILLPLTAVSVGVFVAAEVAWWLFALGIILWVHGREVLDDLPAARPPDNTRPKTGDTSCETT